MPPFGPEVSPRHREDIIAAPGWKQMVELYLKTHSQNWSGPRLVLAGQALRKSNPINEQFISSQTKPHKLLGGVGGRDLMIPMTLIMLFESKQQNTGMIPSPQRSALFSSHPSPANVKQRQQANLS